MARQKLSKAPRQSIMCEYPRCGRNKVRRMETGRLPARRKWCYLHFNGELAGQRRAYVARLKAKERDNG